ncbi:MAG TPA: hypothetical protein VGP64_04470 [Polyangia bacterium]|jgi:hypothetical protein
MSFSRGWLAGNRLTLLAGLALALATACGGQTQSGGSGGSGGSTNGSGGSNSASGGTTGTGGAATGSGGSNSGSGGDASNAGGSTGSGGAVSSGGASGGNGAGDGGSTAAGGSTASGGAVGTGGAGGHGGTGTGGSTGSGGAAGSSGAGGGAASPVTPTQVSGGSTYGFTFGDVVFQVDASTGGRVSKLSLSGTDLIVGPATDPTTWGAVFWTSPRSAWTPETWPPPAAIDNSAYAPMISGSHLVMTGSADPGLNVAMVKDYTADATSGWITINYTIDASKAIKAAPWEVARVPRGGLVFFPLGTASSLAAGPLTVTQSGGAVWFDDASKKATSPSGDKLAADGAMGWEAYALSGNLFLKRFTDTPPSGQVPSPEGEICIYPGATWLEFEVQGPDTSIAANGNLPWKVQWKVVKIPSSVTVSAGSSSLFSFAQQQAAQ